MQWISVEERLPEIMTCVTILRKGYCLESFDAYLVNTGNWWTTKGAGGFVFTDVTHWAPIVPEAEPDGWISVEERLPEDGVKVHVKRDLAPRETVASHGTCWWLHTVGDSGSAIVLGITHWAPLIPEPPELDGWISVEEREPPRYCDILGWAEGRGKFIAWQGAISWHGYQSVPFGQMVAIDSPTHWMLLPGTLPTDELTSGGLKCPHCKKALRLEQYTSYFAIHDTKVCPYCEKVMQIGHRLAKADA